MLSLIVAYRSFGRFRQASTHLDTPPLSLRRHPVSLIAQGNADKITERADTRWTKPGGNRIQPAYRHSVDPNRARVTGRRNSSKVLAMNRSALTLQPSRAADFETLSAWFPDEQALVQWGGEL